MTAEQIDLIKESWSALLADVRAHYDNILSTEDLKNLTVNQLLELIEFSKSLIGKMKKVQEDKKKAEEDFNVATFLYEDAKKNLDQVISVFDNLEKLSSENERAYENHLREVCVAEEMFREIEKEIQAFEKKITQDFEEMTNIRKILISLGL